MARLAPMQLAPGTKVVRGPGWDYGMQDGGPGCQEEVIKCTVAMKGSSNLNAYVLWDKGDENCYCWGNSKGRYDLKVCI